VKPTYRALNKRLVLCACDRRLFLSGLFAGVSMLMLFGSLTFGVVIFSVFATTGWFQARDPVLFLLLLSFGRHPAQFDPAKFQPFSVIFYASDF
jgi:type IV secretory pathway TrbD component